MNCPLQSPETEDLLLDYAAGKLAGRPALELERHFLQCAACDAFRQQQAAVWEALDEWHPKPVSVDFNRELWRRIDAIAREPWYVRLFESFRLGNWRPALPLSAAALVVAAGFFLDQRTTGISPLPAAGASASIVDATEVEQVLSDIELLRQFHQNEAGHSAPM